MSFTSINIINEASIRGDYFINSTECERRALVVTFTERGNIDLVGTGFGGDFLLSQGCDVVAIKTTASRWFEDLNNEMVTRIIEELDYRGRSYSFRASYGSSMGGYAAIRFSKDLRIDRVLAISPLYSIFLDEDRRYSEDGALLSQLEMMKPEFIGKETNFFVVYDPFSKDKIHIDRFKKIIGGEKFHLLEVPFSGHPSGLVLNEIGQLKEVGSRVLLDGVFPSLRSVLNRRRYSPTYLYCLGEALNRHHKYKWATAVLIRASEINPRSAEIFTQLTIAHLGTTNTKEALFAAMTSVELDFGNVHRRLNLLDVLERTEMFQQAIALIDKMLCDVANNPDNASRQHYQYRRECVLAKMRKSR